MSRVKKIMLSAWAAERYDPLPPIHTLRRWAREAQIVPAPELVGGEYMVLANAERVGVPRAGHVGLADRAAA